MAWMLRKPLAGGVLGISERARSDHRRDALVGNEVELRLARKNSASRLPTIPVAFLRWKTMRCLGSAIE